MTVDYRELDAGDDDLLVEATLGNVNWCGDRFTRDDVVNDPALTKYTHLDPDRGDFGIVAVDGSTPVGVAWGLYLPAPGGYGYLDPKTPEFSLWVAAAHRRRGLGRALTERFLTAATRRGVGQVSLSVEDGNTGARVLYLATGFVPAAGRHHDGVYVRDLAANE